MKSLSTVQLFATLWTVAYQAPQSMGFSRQEYWSGVPFPSPGDLPNPGIEPRSRALQADALLSELPGKPLLMGAVQIKWEKEIIRSSTHFSYFLFNRYYGFCSRAVAKHRLWIQCIIFVPIRIDYLWRKPREKLVKNLGQTYHCSILLFLHSPGFLCACINVYFFFF